MNLSKGFIFTAFANFTVGAILGGLMTLVPGIAGRLAPIHAILNPYGWLTILIYGMTFTVLGLSLGVRLPTIWQGWLQLVCAQGGVLLLILGAVLGSKAASHIGVIILVVSPLLFLYNILSGVRYTKRSQASQSAVQKPLEKEPPVPNDTAVRLFGRFAAYKRTDAVGQRGTDISLMIFVVAVIWAAILDWHGFPYIQFAFSPALDWFMFYGWIGSTTLSVALHLAPRFLRRSVGPALWWSSLQIIWFVGVACGVVGVWFGGRWNHLGCGLVGISLCATAVSYLWLAISTSSASRPVKDAERRRMNTRYLFGPGYVAWLAAWLFALCLGINLTVGAAPFTLASIHLLFLGFITSLVFAVGYTAFPAVLGRRLPRLSWSYIQLVCSEVGAAVLIIAFSAAGFGSQQNHVALAIGGVLATVGILLFLGFFSIRRPSTESRPTRTAKSLR